MIPSERMRVQIYPLFFMLILLISLLSACAPTEEIIIPTSFSPTDEPTALPAFSTNTASPLPIDTPQPTATPFPTNTLAPTLSPMAITASNIDKLTRIYTLTDAYGGLYGVAITSDGGLIATASSDRSVRLYDGASGELLYELEHHKHWVYAVVFSLDETRLFSGGRDQTVQIWDTSSGERITGMRTSGEVFRLARSPDGEQIAAAVLWNAIGEVWQAETGASLFRLEGHQTRLRSVAYSPDGLWLATGDKDGVVLLRDPATGEVLETLINTGGEVLAMAFSLNGSTLAVGLSNGDLVIWDLATVEIIETKRIHGGGVWSIVYSPDGSLLITAGLDGSIQFRDPLTLDRLRAVSHGAAVRSIAISADGQRLVSGGDDGRARVWQIVE